MLSVKNDLLFTQSIFQARSCEHASILTLLLEDHVWSDLSRLVDFSFKNGLYVVLLKAFFRLEEYSDLNMPQTGLCCQRRT